MTTTADRLDYLDHLARESRRFAEALRTAAPQARVPSCPDWEATDLLWHLGRVQWFWGSIVGRRLTDAAEVRALDVDRPGDQDGLWAFYEQAGADLRGTLAATAAGTPVWTWFTDQSVDFVLRRQAHEALIHRVDAELTAGCRTALDPALSADGVDEALRIMFGSAPPWCRFDPSAARVRVAAVDTGDSWVVRPGRWVGSDPEGAESMDAPGLEVAPADDGGDVAATVGGAAADLDCWLWGRPPLGALERSGDVVALTGLDEVLAAGIS